MSKKLKLGGLALIVACALGVIPASAQATPQFTVEGVSSGNEAIASTTTVTPVGGVLTLTVPGHLSITCTGLTVNGGSVTVDSDQGSATSFSLTGCSVDDSKGVEQPNCKVRNVGGVAGTITTGGLTMTVVEVGSAGYVTFKSTKTTLVEILIEGASCSLASTTAVSGTIGMKISSPVKGVLATTVELESSQAIQEAGKDTLTFGLTMAYLDGRIDLHLTSDRKWGFDL